MVNAQPIPTAVYNGSMAAIPAAEMRQRERFMSAVAPKEREEKRSTINVAMEKC